MMIPEDDKIALATLSSEIRGDVKQERVGNQPKNREGTAKSGASAEKSQPRMDAN
jgi:hypothetical protein